MNGLNFGVFLHNVRRQKHMTIETLSELSGISNAQISRLETNVRGNPKPETIKKLAEALSMRYESMLEVAGYMTRPAATKMPGIGKANNFKTDTVERYKINNGMTTVSMSTVINDWCEKNPDKHVIDIKPTEQYTLIIYREV